MTPSLRRAVRVVAGAAAAAMFSLHCAKQNAPPTGPGGGGTPASIATIVVSPNNETILTSSTLQFSAVGKDAAGNTVAFTPTWSVSGGGTINGSGLFTAGASTGTSTIRASQGDVAGSATVLVSGTRLVFVFQPGRTPASNRILSRLVQPGACYGGDTHVLPITVRSVDQAGHFVPNGEVTLKLGSNPAGGTLSGKLSESAQNSYRPSDVAFGEVRISAAGNGYTLIASSPGKVSTTSNPFVILPSPTSPAVRLFFDRVVCTSGESSVWWNLWEVGTQSHRPIEVTAVDDAWRLDNRLDGEFPGNVVTTYSGPVTLSVESGGRLDGTLTVNAVNGRASFPDLVPQDGGAYVIAATAPGLIAHSWGFNVTPQATALVFPQPVPTLRVGTSVVDGALYELYVSVKGSSGAAAQAYNGPVTLSIGANPGGASLSASRGTTVNAEGGTASFGEVRITKPGLGYTLVASAPGLQSGTSQPFDVLGMAFVQQPQTTTQGRAFSVKVVALDAMGNVDATYDNKPALLRIGNDGSPGKNAALCNAQGCTSGQQNSLQGRFSRGVAEFAGVTINQPGTGYTLTARFSYTELVGAESTTFDVTPAVP
jgi:hypothetical protein